MTRYEKDEKPTNPDNGPRTKSNPDLDYRLGQLMVETVNHRRRLETIEAEVLYRKITRSEPPTKQSLLALARKTLTTTLIVLASIISALKELGFLHE